jgi:hypothetical protein
VVEAALGEQAHGNARDLLPHCELLRLAQTHSRSVSAFTLAEKF